MSDPIVKREMDNLSGIFKIIHMAKVVPQSERNSREFNSALAAAAVLHGLISL
jgi:hypothetical protein